MADSGSVEVTEQLPGRIEQIVVDLGGGRVCERAVGQVGDEQRIAGPGHADGDDGGNRDPAFLGEQHGERFVLDLLAAVGSELCVVAFVPGLTPQPALSTGAPCVAPEPVDEHVPAIARDP